MTDRPSGVVKRLSVTVSNTFIFFPFSNLIITISKREDEIVKQAAIASLCYVVTLYMYGYVVSVVTVDCCQFSVSS